MHCPECGEPLQWQSRIEEGNLLIVFTICQNPQCEINKCICTKFVQAIENR